jgi:hypothetical protein
MLVTRHFDDLPIFYHAHSNSHVQSFLTHYFSLRYSLFAIRHSDWELRGVMRMLERTPHVDTNF